MVQKVLRGRGSLARLPEMMEQLHIQKPLVVCGDRLYAVLEARAGVTGTRFTAYHPNPDFADCAAGAEAYRRGGCDGIISLGGGSAMYTAKAVKAYLLAADPEDAMNSRLPEGRGMPHIAIPATAGTGSEAT